MKSSKPVIGIVPDFNEGEKGSYSVKNFYALRVNHVEMINKNGGAAIILPYDYGLIDDYLNSIDAILIVGGYFDINPKRYGEAVHPEVKLNEVRENFEYAIAKKALSKKMPFLGICNGLSLINVLHNGSAIQHIPDHNIYINHEQSKIDGYEDYVTPYHDVILDKNSKLYEIIGREKIKTNSSHHQAVNKLGDNLLISAKAIDGIIEAIESKDKDHPYLVGVQWHPEFESSQHDTKIFESFVNAAKNYKLNNNDK